MKRQKPHVLFLTIPDLVSGKAICCLFRVVPMTLNRWRRFYGMPHTRIAGTKAVMYDFYKVKAWAKEQGIKVPITRKTK